MEKFRTTKKYIMSTGKNICFFILIVILNISAAVAQEGQEWISYEPGDGPGNGKHIVLISGDEEYRSEEALPMLAKILAKHHGFKTTVLFAIDPETGKVDPDNQENIPGLDQLETADLMIMFLRFRELPDEQMKYIDEYMAAGKPVVALRTSTHAFNYSRNKNSPFAKYSFDSAAEGWEGGFGRKVLGETWIAHHGNHGKESTRGLVNGLLENHAILRGVKDIWGATDVYTVRDLDKAEVLVYGQSTHGMTAESPLSFQKSVMPVAWIKYYTNENGNTARIFNTTMGAAIDLESEDLRRLLVNACYWAVGMDHQIPEKNFVDIIGEYDPTMFGYGDFKKGLTPSDFK
jgi:hypothetical protein